MQELDFCDSDPALVYEDMTFMSDFELHKLCCKYPVNIKINMENNKV